MTETDAALTPDVMLGSRLGVGGNRVEMFGSECLRMFTRPRKVTSKRHSLPKSIPHPLSSLCALLWRLPF